jgi:cytochrome c peroxidase
VTTKRQEMHKYSNTKFDENTTLDTSAEQMSKSSISFSISAAIFIFIVWGFAGAHETVNVAASVATEATNTLLGERLFFDKRLSADGKISCATCHQPERAFSDGLATARGINAQSGQRNTPSLFNVGEQRALFWDGRRAGLETQVVDPFTNSIEHGLPNAESVVATVRADSSYTAAVQAAFNIKLERLTFQQLASALAAFQRTLKAPPSPFERYWLSGEDLAISDRAKKGLTLFQGAAGCAQCHSMGSAQKREAALTDHEFHEVSVRVESVQSRLPKLASRAMRAAPDEIDRLVSQDGGVAALGRFLATKNPKDIGKFKTPSLRNVAVTAPYMHNGSVATLEQAIDAELYYRSAKLGKAIVLTQEEKQDVKLFLETLTTPPWRKDAAPSKR